MGRKKGGCRGERGGNADVPKARFVFLLGSIYSNIMSLLSLAFLTTAAFAIATTPTQCNIHVKLPAAPTSNITDTQKQLSLLFSNPSDQALDFTSVNDPHVTLFLTTFTDINSPDFISAAEVSLKQAYATSCAPTTYINIGELHPFPSPTITATYTS